MVFRFLAVGLYTNESPTRNSAMNGAVVRVCGIVLIFVNTNLIHFNAKSIPVELSSWRQEFSRHFKPRLCWCASSQLRLSPILHSHQTLSELGLTFLLWEKIFLNCHQKKSHLRRQRLWCDQSWVLYIKIFISLQVFVHSFSWDIWIFSISLTVGPREPNLCLVTFDFLSHLACLFQPG